MTVIACVFGFTGCSSPKKFEKAGMEITLTSAFTEKELVSQTAYYESSTAICTALKEEFTSFPETTDISTLEKYTELVLSVNKLSSSETNAREGQDYLYFTYEKTVSGKSFYYLGTTHKGPDAYWLIQFACTAENKDKFTETFLGYADTVTFVEG